jgi:hypothetical protein
MAWEAEYTDEFGDWYHQQDEDVQDAIIAAVDCLERDGPGLGRPIVDTLRGSRHPNMKELRPPIGTVRILFAFDPRRKAILLLGGDKAHRWNSWYDEMIPIADRLYDEHLQTLQKEGLLP